MERARGAIRGLMQLAPADALVRRGQREERIPIDAVATGDVVLVGPGEKIPVDGRVLEGTSHVNQAPVTGESLPAEKTAGDEVFAGTINGRGALDVEVTRLRRDSTLARIIHLVERAQAERAPSQAFVDTFARIYTPIVLAVAVLVALVPPLALGGSWDDWFYRALVLLVISCPCALVISTPVSVVSGLAAAARKGVLIKGGAHLEKLARVTCVAFDKTGTLSKGRLQVQSILPFNGATHDEVLAIAAALESRSEHPIGRAIVRARGCIGADRAAEHQLPDDSGPWRRGGRGRCGRRGRQPPSALGGRAVVAPARKRSGIDLGRWSNPRDRRARRCRARSDWCRGPDARRRAGSPRRAARPGDPPRRDADRRSLRSARGFAAAVGVDDVRAELLPEDKVKSVEALKATHGVVAMVGDGINDAPALASADVGIAMGAAGTDVALETADIALMADDLGKIPYAVRLSRATSRNIRANIAFSIALKGAFLVLAVAGVATLWMAVAADMGASLLVIGNALQIATRVIPIPYRSSLIPRSNPSSRISRIRIPDLIRIRIRDSRLGIGSR